MLILQLSSSLCSGSGCATVGMTVVYSIRVRCFRRCISILLFVEDWVFVDIANSQAQTSRTDVPMSNNEHDAEHRLSAEVKDTVENRLRIWSNDVAALAYTPSNGIAKPEEQGPDSADQIHTIDIIPQTLGMDTALPGNVVEDVEHCCTAEREET